MKGVFINLDKTRLLRYDLNALAQIEQELNIKLTKSDLADLSIGELLTVIHIGLKQEDPDLTRQEVGSLISDNIPLKDAAQKVAEAITLSVNGGKKSAAPGAPAIPTMEA